MRKIRGASLRIGLALFVVYTLVSLVLIGNAYAAKDKTNDITPTMLRGRVLVTYVSGNVTAVDIIDGSGFTVTKYADYFEIVPDNPFASAPSVFVNLGDAISDDGFSQASSEYSFNAWADRIAIANTFPGFTFWTYFDFLAIGETQ